MIALFNIVNALHGTKKNQQNHFLHSSILLFPCTGGWVKIEVNGATSCANLRDYKPKTVRAIFSRDGVQGEITFTQDNPYKPTMVNVDLQVPQLCSLCRKYETMILGFIQLFCYPDWQCK